MMFNDWIKDDSLFSAINEVGEIDFITVLGTERLDNYYRLLYGSRHIPKHMENMSVKEVADIISLQYAHIWNEEFSYLLDELELGTLKEVTERVTVTDEQLRTMSSESKNKVSAFNEDDMTDRDESIDSVNDTTNKDTTTERIRTEQDFNIVTKQIELLRSKFVYGICQDISKLLSLSIY